MRAALSSPPVKHDRQIVVRLPAELYARIEERAAALREATGLTVSIADIVRKLLTDALAAADEQDRKPRKPR